MGKFYSILVYLVVFVASLFFVQRAENSLRRSKKWEYRLTASIALILPCLLAGFRGIDVGSDTVRYYEVYEIALNYNNLTDYIARMTLQNIEVGYSVFIFLLSRFRISRGLLFFIQQFLTIYPIFNVLKKNTHDFPMWTGIAVYYALFYNMSFNATRQCIAVAFILLMHQMLIEKQNLRAILCAVVAMSFHSSAYIGIVFVFASVVFKNIKLSLVRQVGVFFIFIAVAMAPTYIDKVFDILKSIGLLSERQSFYQSLFSGDRVMAGSEGIAGGGYILILMRILFLCIPGIDLFFLKRLKESQIKATSVVVLMGTVFYVFTSVALNTIHVYRITMYPEIFNVLYIPLLYRKSNKTWSVSIKTVVLIAMLIAYWYLIFIKYGLHQTNNYFMI